MLQRRGKYIQGDVGKKAALLADHGALMLDELPKDLTNTDADDLLVVVVYNPAFDAALICDEHELKRVWESINAGDRREMEVFVLGKDQIEQTA